MSNKTKINWLSRKLIFGYTLFGFSTLFMFIVPDVTFVEWANFQKWLFGIYIVGNVGAKGVKEIDKIRRHDVNDQ